MSLSNWDTKRFFQPPAFREIEQHDGLRGIVFENETYRGGKSEVFAWLGQPPAHTGAAMPGMVLVHGGGGKAFPEWVKMWVERGYAAIAMDLAGRGPDGERLAHAGPGQGFEDKFSTELGWEDMWTYHAVAAVLRAHSILRALPGVDGKRTGVTGISWGGYLTCIVAAVDTRFACAVPVYGCGFLQQNSAIDWMKRFGAMTPEQARTWHERCDPAVYLPHARLPMLFVAGTNDRAYPLDILTRSMTLPAGAVTACIRIEMPHGHTPGWAPQEIHLFTDSMLRAGDPLPQLGLARLTGCRLSAAWSSARPLATALLPYTCDDGPWQDRKWHVGAARFEQDRVSGDLPDGVSAAYLAVEDDRGAYVSCPPILCPSP